MNRIRVPLLIASTLLAIPAWGQVQGTMTLTQAFATIKPGQWVRLEGVPQRDQSVLCTQVKVLVGVVRETDWTLRGMLKTIDAAKNELHISGYHVKIGQEFKVKTDAGVRITLADLKPNMLVKAEGTFTDGVLVARKVVDQSTDLKAKPGIDQKLLLQGKVHRIDPAKRTMTVMGTTFLVSDRTQIKSAAP